jgi:hypothetical protein
MHEKVKSAFLTLSTKSFHEWECNRMHANVGTTYTHHSKNEL